MRAGWWWARLALVVAGVARSRSRSCRRRAFFVLARRCSRALQRCFGQLVPFPGLQRAHGRGERRRPRSAEQGAAPRRHGRRRAVARTRPALPRPGRARPERRRASHARWPAGDRRGRARTARRPRLIPDAAKASTPRVIEIGNHFRRPVGGIPEGSRRGGGAPQVGRKSLPQGYARPFGAGSCG
jgi:hypothetical protein